MSLKNKIFVSYTVAFLTTILAVFYSYGDFDVYVEEENYFFCGTSSIEQENREGGKLFKSLCASCHKLNKKLVGPALGGLEMDSVRLYKYLLSKKHTPTFPQLTQENIIEILKYTT